MNTDKTLQRIWDEHKNTAKANDEITSLCADLRLQLQCVSKTVEKIAAARMAVIDENMRTV